MNLYGYAGGDPINNSDPFGLCPDPNDPACKVGGGVVTLSFGGTAGFGAVGSHFAVGIAINKRGDAMFFAQAGPSIAVGASAGPELGWQRGSLNDMVGATGENPGFALTASVPSLPSLSVSGDETGRFTGFAVGARGGAVGALNITTASVGSSTVNVAQKLRDAKAAAKRFVDEGLTAARCASGICSP